MEVDLSDRVFQLVREHWKNRTISSNGVRTTYRVECCPIIINSTELDTKSNCHIIETISWNINTTEPLLEAETTLPPVSVRKDQVCK